MYIKKIVFGSLFVFVSFLIFMCISLDSRNKYIEGDIDSIVYAEPTQEAKEFNIENYIDSLSSVEYKKIVYPVKEIYTYEFNGYILTVDVPEGFEVYRSEGKFNKDAQKDLMVIESKGIEDSCDEDYGSADSGCTGPKYKDWYHVPLGSSNPLCLNEIKIESGQERIGCDITFYPKKSRFTGVSLRDYYMNVIDRYKYKFKTRSGALFLLKDLNENEPVVSLISNDQMMQISRGSSFYLLEQRKDFSISKNLFLSVLDSTKIVRRE